MKKFEYKIIVIASGSVSVSEFNQLGADGWELTSAVTNTRQIMSFFKREIHEPITIPVTGRPNEVAISGTGKTAF